MALPTGGVSAAEIRDSSGSGRVHFFISYTAADKDWAEWIAWQLEEARYTVRIQAWDSRPGNDFVVWMDQAVREAERILVVLSPAYEQATSFTMPEWSAALGRDPSGRLGVLLPVRVANFAPGGVFRTRSYIDVVGQDKPEAQATLLAGVRAVRAKPSVEPSYPDRLDRPVPETRPILPATALLGRPVHELTDPFALEVHRSIEAPVRAASLPVLPIYVQRDHDRQLQAIVKRAVDGRSAVVLLVGGSSTGKTRACWEAVQELPRDWRLWHPIDPSRPEGAAEAILAVGPRTVIWLNEAQHYLLTPASSLGERVAAGLRELLRDPERSPVLLLGTIWPEYWATLTTPPRPGQTDDPHAQARELLIGNDLPVPDAFAGPALRAVQAAARADPRLAEATIHAENGRITQFLAGGPALLERYRHAPVAAKAVIEAAMDARRLGHSVYLPRALLEVAAPGYLSDAQWNALDEDWLESALAYCATASRGAPGPLTRIRPRPGEPSPEQPQYRLADYLEQTGRATRRTVLVPAELWNAFVEHADSEIVARIGEEAQRRSLYRYAFRLYGRAADAGDPGAPGAVARLLEQAGRTEEAIDWYQRAAIAGNWSNALEEAARLLEQAGRTDEAEQLRQCGLEPSGKTTNEWPLHG